MGGTRFSGWFPEKSVMHKTVPVRLLSAWTAGGRPRRGAHCMSDTSCRKSFTIGIYQSSCVEPLFLITFSSSLDTSFVTLRTYFVILYPLSRHLQKSPNISRHEVTKSGLPLLPQEAQNRNFRADALDVRSGTTAECRAPLGKPARSPY